MFVSIQGVRAYRQRRAAASRLSLPAHAGSSSSLYVTPLSLRTRAGQLFAAADARPFAGPRLPPLGQRDALHRAAVTRWPRAAERKNVRPIKSRVGKSRPPASPQQAI